MSHFQILVLVITAVAGAGTRNLSLEVPDELKHGSDQGNDLRRSVFPGKEEIKAGPAAHGTKIDDFTAEIRIVPQKSGSQMLDRMHFSRIHDRFAVRSCHPQIKGGDGSISKVVDPRHIDPRLKQEMRHNPKFRDTDADWIVR